MEAMGLPQPTGAAGAELSTSGIEMLKLALTRSSDMQRTQYLQSCYEPWRYLG